MIQNWTHVQTVVTKLNEESSEHHNTDINRVRPMYVLVIFNTSSVSNYCSTISESVIKVCLMFRYLDGHARFYRQSIILSSYLTPGAFMAKLLLGF